MHTAESRVTGPERKGFWRELGDELLDKEDLEHERRFDMRSLPLILLALVSGVVWSRTRQEWAMAVGACALAAYGAYFLWNRAVYVVRLLRGRNVLEKSAKPRRSARVDTALVRRLTRLADDDRLYALVGIWTDQLDVGVVGAGGVGGCIRSVLANGGVRQSEPASGVHGGRAGCAAARSRAAHGDHAPRQRAGQPHA